MFQESGFIDRKRIALMKLLSRSDEIFEVILKVTNPRLTQLPIYWSASVNRIEISGDIAYSSFVRRAHPLFIRLLRCSIRYSKTAENGVNATRVSVRAFSRCSGCLRFRDTNRG